eukprot:TRINITY_DN5960_c0_g1_i1.p1 TRINITY_DN5960_c0_g1~~TRINITY_DN5960_c0_g1_i1.p1  ORF type:complete len:444 (-),score=55.71 TRINITY_DN5960_c0_g1_i1:6-1337(-)
MEGSLKIARETRLSNLEGSSLGTIVFVLLVVPLVCVTQRLLLWVFPKKNFWLDFFVTVLPLVLTITAYHYSLYLFLVLVACSAALVIGQVRKGNYYFKYNSTHGLLDEKKKPFLNSYRASMMLLTCVSIFAVDFPIFPLQFAKTEVYGISLMDVGVGGFMFSMALVSQKARRVGNNSVSRVNHIVNIIRQVIPVLVIGLGRTILLKTINYQEHASEYGLHWNFFLTIAFVNILAAIIDVPCKYSSALGCGLIIFYQLLLSNGLENYILHAERVNLVSQNKEGIFGVFGFTSIYLIGTHIGSVLHKKKSKQEWIQFWCALIFIVALCSILALYLEFGIGIQPSRRLVNITYVLISITVNLQPLIILMALDMFGVSGNSGIVIDTVSSNQLFVFMLANVLTGIINVLDDPLNMSVFKSNGVIISYMALVCFVPYFIYEKRKNKND